MSFSVLRMNSAMVVGLVKRRNAKLRNAKLRIAQLINAKLKDTMFRTAMPRNAKLRNAKLKNAKLRNAKLRNAKLFLLYHAREFHLFRIGPFVADCRHLHCSSRRPSP